MNLSGLLRHKPKASNDSVLVVPNEENRAIWPEIGTSSDVRVLKEHHQAVMRICQRNMRQYYDYERELACGPDSVRKMSPEFVDLIENVFPRQFNQLRCLDLIGVHPACGPCNILLIENGEPYASAYSEIPMEWRHDHLVRNAQEWQTMARNVELLSERYGVRLDVPDVQNLRLKQVSYVVRSQVINRSATERGDAEDYAALMDRTIILSVLHSALEGSWDALDGLEGAYVICHPAVAHIVQKRSGLAPICFDFIRPSEAFIGYKKSEYNAAGYFMPYIPLQMVRYMDEQTFEPKVAYKTRYGLMGGNDWNWPDQRKSEFVKVKIL
jgi:hypothetical protein